MGVWSAVVSLVLLAVGCGDERHRALERGGIRIAMVERSAPAATPGGVVAVPGDFVIEGEGMRVLVGGLRRAGEARGAVLEAVLEGAPADDSVVLVAPRVMVGADGYAVVARAMYVVERRGKPVLRIEGDVRVGEERLVNVHQELTVADAGQAVAFVTRVAPEDDEPLEQVRVAARISWGGASPFMPGVGPLDDSMWHDGNWIARSGTEMATAFGFRPPPAHARAFFEQHGASRFLSYTNVASPRADIGEDDAYVVRSALVLGRPSVAQALRRLGWVRGEPFPEVLVTLPFAPPGSTIHLRTDAGDPLLETKPYARGQALVPLTPVGVRHRAERWTVWATAFGHAPSDEVTIERPGQRVTLEIPRGNRLRVSIVDAATGRPVPGRIRIRGVGETPTPRLGPEERADGAVDTVVTADGFATVHLSPGTYGVTVTRGPEWTIVEAQVDVTRTFSPEVRAALSHVVDPGDWIGADFHVHASPSPDSQVALADRIASLLAEGVRFAVPTDHNYVTDYSSAMDGLATEGFGTVPGVEVTTWAPAYGHFNAYPWQVDSDAPAGGAPGYSGTTPAQLFARLREAGEDVIVQVNHPRFENGIGYFEVLGLDARTGTASDWYSDDFDALEVWNGFDLARPDMFERVLIDWMWLLARGHRVVATGSSDSHKVHFQWAGYPRTYVRVPGGSVEDPYAVVRALRAGHAFVTSGPFLEVRVGDAIPGDTATVRGPDIQAHVTVRAPPWMDVSQLDFHVGPRIVRSVPVAPDPVDGAPPVVRFEGTVPVPYGPGGYLVVVARGERPMERLFGRSGVLPVAFTNPIFLERPAAGPTGRPRPDAGGPAEASSDAGSDPGGL